MKIWEPKDGCEKVKVLTDYKLGKELPKEKLAWIARFYEQAWEIEREKA